MRSNVDKYKDRPHLYAILNEPGRFRGYLQNNDKGLDKIKGQISNFRDIQPGLSIFERSD
jgi:hypothetical protein